MSSAEGPSARESPRRVAGPRRRPAWARWADEKLLDLRLCDLGVRIQRTEIQRRSRRLLDELERAGIRFRPHFWLSDEWFTPDGVPGVAVPFYLAHPRLLRLEKKQMLEAEGESLESCMRILRHEAGHAINNAYGLHRRRRWRKLFGSFSERYPEFYQPRPYSKRYVQNLGSWYAQSHPAEDFAETFAVWLRPGSLWRKRYAGWPALRKLEYVDALMAEIGRGDPPVSSRSRVDPLSRLRRSLREHYERRRATYGTVVPDFYDRDLRQLFSEAPEHAHLASAAILLNRLRPAIRRAVAKGTGQYQYTIDQALKRMVDRCRELKLRVHRPEDQVLLEATILMTVQTMNYLHSGHHRLAL